MSKVAGPYSLSSLQLPLQLHRVLLHYLLFVDVNKAG